MATAGRRGAARTRRWATHTEARRRAALVDARHAARRRQRLARGRAVGVLAAPPAERRARPGDVPGRSVSPPPPPMSTCTGRAGAATRRRAQTGGGAAARAAVVALLQLLRAPAGSAAENSNSRDARRSAAQRAAHLLGGVVLDVRLVVVPRSRVHRLRAPRRSPSISCCSRARAAGSRPRPPPAPGRAAGRRRPRLRTVRRAAHGARRVAAEPPRAAPSSTGGGAPNMRLAALSWRYADERPAAGDCIVLRSKSSWRTRCPELLNFSSTRAPAAIDLNSAVCGSENSVGCAAFAAALRTAWHAPPHDADPPRPRRPHHPALLPRARAPQHPRGIKIGAVPPAPTLNALRGGAARERSRAPTIDELRDKEASRSGSCATGQ